MTAYIKGNIVEGSLEEIAKLLGITLDDSNCITTDHIPAQSYPPNYNQGFYYPEFDDCLKQWKKEESK